MRTLKEIRFVKGIRQEEIGEIIGFPQLPQPVISMIEAGWVIPNPVIRDRIEAALGEKLDWEQPFKLWKIKYQQGKNPPKQRRVVKKKSANESQ